MASRYSQSEESLYRGAVPRGLHDWSLMVTFGKKYTALQQLVEWLEVWGNKSHSLGGGEELLEIMPKMRIRIPAQLIILSLWLLENKYNRSAHEEVKARRVSRGSRARRLSHSPSGRRRQSASPGGSQGSGTRSRGRSGTPPMAPEPHLYSQSAKSRMTQQVIPPGVKVVTGSTLRPQPRSRHTSPQDQDALQRSLQQSTLDQEEIIDAYTQMLDGPEDSSSIGVSSLASDELDGDLKNTLNVIRGTSPNKDSSTLNQTIFPKDESPERAKAQLSPPKGSSTPLGKQQTADGRTPSVSPPPQSRKSAGQDSMSQQQQQQQQHSHAGSIHLSQQGNPADLAAQLQGVIRDELRRIMEVQHRSVLAMMGALDTVAVPGDPQPALTNITNNKEMSASQASRSHRQTSAHKQQTRPQVGSSPTRAVVTAWSDDDTTVRSVTLQEDLMSQSSVKARRRAARKDGQMRETLAELHNLQDQSTKFPHPGGRKVHHNSQSEDLSMSGRHRGSKYQGPPRHNEENLRLPYMAFQAWPERQAPPPSNQEVPRLPLLHLDKPEDHQPLDPFTNLRKFLPQVPTPVHHQPPLSHFHQHHHPPPPPQQQPPMQDFSSFSFFQPKSQPVNQRMPPPPYEQRPLPLLSAAPPQENQMGGLRSGFPLLKFLPPGMGYGDEDTNRNRVEETRRRLLNQFTAQLMKDKENVLRQDHQFLHFDRRGELRRSREELTRSMESVASKASEKEVSERSEAIPEDGEKEEVTEEVQGVTTVTEQSQMPQTAQPTTSDATPINDGFALPRGIFESYLQLGENLFGPEVNETNAALHMQLAEAMHRHAAKRVRAKVDFSTMTQEQIDAGVDAEVVRTAEAATSITKDTGSDPIQEALDEHKRHNNLVPPDIFMGLRFTDQDSQSGVAAGAPSADTSRGRAFLNVADIRASAILKDIPERDKKPQQTVDEEKTDTAVLASTRTAQQIGAMEETLREKFAPQERQPHGYDSVTVRMFDQLKSRDDSVSVAVIPRSSVSEPKSAMIRRLRDMSDQIRAIDEMSQNIERDFKSSHMLLNTIQDVNESIQTSRSASPEPTRKMKKKRKELSYSLEEEDYESRSPSRVPTPKSSHRSPQISARSAKSKSSLASRSGGDMSQTELTELIEEVLTKEGLDAEEISQEISEQLERYARDRLHSDRRSARSSPRKQFLSPRKGEEKGKRTEEERERLKAWMMEKFHERHEEYRKRRQENIEREPHPFKPQSSSAVSHLDLKHLESDIKEKRKVMMSEFMDQRLAEAEDLLGSILVEKPELPWVEGEETHRDLSRSPGRGHSSSRSAVQARSRAVKERKSRSPTRRGTHTLTDRQIMASRSPRDRHSSHLSDTSPVKGILKTSSTQDLHPTGSSTGGMGDHPVLASISEGVRTADSSVELTNYARAILERDGELSSVASMDFLAHPRTTPVHRAASPQSTTAQSRTSGASRGKMLSDLVRMQRPEVTRKWKETVQMRKAHEENLASARDTQRSKSSADPNMQKEKQKVYGSKQIPGSSPRSALPRRVKTYTERLKDMRGTGVSSGTFRTASSGRKRPPHRPQTYVQQLQGMKGQGGAQPGSGRQIPVAGRTYMRSHGPLHKPKTYTERLQDLNPHPHPQQATGVSTRTQLRSRPYRDPYADMDPEELSMLLSDDDIDDYARNIIYGGSTAASSVGFMLDDLDMSVSTRDHGGVAPSEGQSDYYEAIMGAGRDLPFRTKGDDDYAPGDYRSSVDIHEIERIADEASVGSGSVLSVIDWDEINNIIKDEQN